MEQRIAFCTTSDGVRIAYVFDTRVALLIAGLLAVGLNVIAVRRSGLLSLD